MTDIHTHILPNVDDGSSSMQESLDMITALSALGFSGAVVTPHFDAGRESMLFFSGKVSQALSSLREKAGNFKLFSGSEVFLCHNLFLYDDIGDLCIENTRYLLLELPFTKKWNKELFSSIVRLKEDYRVIPVIAHVELYPAVKKNLDAALTLVKAGCLIQVDSCSLLDNTLKKIVFKLAQKNALHFIASDTHNMTSRPPVMTEPLAILEEQFGKELTDKLCENSQKLVANETIIF